MIKLLEPADYLSIVSALDTASGVALLLDFILCVRGSN